MTQPPKPCGTTTVTPKLGDRLLSAAVRNIMALFAALLGFRLLEFHCVWSVIGRYVVLVFAALYVAILWANWNLFGSDSWSAERWAGCILVSVLLFPLYVFIVFVTALLFWMPFRP